MSERSSTPSISSAGNDARRQQPSADIAEFIRFCHHRRPVGWPEIYDEMCAVAARREFHGWGQDELAQRGVSFTLFEMPRLAAWVRYVVDDLPRGQMQPVSQHHPQPMAG
ncbi:MAG TPA: hypothetical protein VHK63_02995 [Candidatus Limnocylindria bacterium]|nr:hypothetical protein [Candidatus Limnocylindria bacterium]